MTAIAVYFVVFNIIVSPAEIFPLSCFVRQTSKRDEGRLSLFKIQLLNNHSLRIGCTTVTGLLMDRCYNGTPKKMSPLHLTSAVVFAARVFAQCADCRLLSSSLRFQRAPRFPLHTSLPNTREVFVAAGSNAAASNSITVQMAVIVSLHKIMKEPPGVSGMPNCGEWLVSAREAVAAIRH